ARGKTCSTRVLVSAALSALRSLPLINDPTPRQMEHKQPTGPAAAMTFLEEVTNYIGFGSRDSALLLEFLPIATPHLKRISEHFYERILNHPQSHEAITGGPEQVERLKRTLAEWMRSGL